MEPRESYVECQEDQGVLKQLGSSISLFKLPWSSSPSFFRLFPGLPGTPSKGLTVKDMRVSAQEESNKYASTGGLTLLLVREIEWVPWECS